MTEFRLGSYRVNDKGLWDFRMAKEPLNKDSLMEYRQNTKVIIDLQPVSIDYETTVKNRDGLFSYIAIINSRLEPSSIPFYSAYDVVHDVMNEMNTLVNNFLLSTRAFVDRSEARIKREFGDNSYEFKSFKKDTSYLYDTYFSYRFLYTLRNYGTHCDIPITNMRGQNDSTDQGLYNSRLAFLVDKERIKNELSLTRKEKNMLDSVEDIFIDIVPLLQEQADSNRFLFTNILQRRKDDIIACQKYMDALKKLLQSRFHMAPEEVPVLWQGVEIPPEWRAGIPTPMKPRLEMIPFAPLERMRRLAISRGPNSLWRGVPSESM